MRGATSRSSSSSLATFRPCVINSSTEAEGQQALVGTPIQKYGVYCFPVPVVASRLVRTRQIEPLFFRVRHHGNRPYRYIMKKYSSILFVALKAFSDRQVNEHEETSGNRREEPIFPGKHEGRGPEVLASPKYWPRSIGLRDHENACQGLFYNWIIAWSADPDSTT